MILDVIIVVTGVLIISILISATILHIFTKIMAFERTSFYSAIKEGHRSRTELFSCTTELESSSAFDRFTLWSVYISLAIDNHTRPEC